MSFGILFHQIQMWPSRWPPQTAAARNAADHNRQVTTWTWLVAELFSAELCRWPTSERLWRLAT